MNERIKMIRKALNLTQQEFAETLGVKRNTVGQWECGINAITDQTIKALCREYNVNEKWLREGEGEMFRVLSKNESIVQFTNQLLSEEQDSFKSKLFVALSRLTEEQWNNLADIIETLYK